MSRNSRNLTTIFSRLFSSSKKTSQMNPLPDHWSKTPTVRGKTPSGGNMADSLTKRGKLDLTWRASTKRTKINNSSSGTWYRYRLPPLAPCNPNGFSPQSSPSSLLLLLGRIFCTIYWLQKLPQSQRTGAMFYLFYRSDFLNLGCGHVARINNRHLWQQ